jgi:hypothetical protein
LEQASAVDRLPVMEKAPKTRKNHDKCAPRVLTAKAIVWGFLHMTFQIRASSKAVVFAGMLLAGCAGDGSDGLFTTGSLSGSQATAASKVDPACVTLATSIEGMRKEGIAEKIEKAAAKKYKMTATDLKKADQLTKANADFQARCSTIGPKATTAQASGVAAPKTQ